MNLSLSPCLRFSPTEKYLRIIILLNVQYENIYLCLLIMSPSVYVCIGPLKNWEMTELIYYR